MRSAPNAQDKIKVADVVVSTNHVIFLTNRFPRLISLLTFTIFCSETSGIKAILKYRSVNPKISNLPIFKCTALALLKCHFFSRQEVLPDYVGV